ncbi:MAG: gamma-butyrobetaine hydroxylase-like domain-containing protein [Bryobacteraceae bacterium]
MRSDPEKISISKSKGVTVQWKDGHRSEFQLAYLRDICPCAECTGTHGTAPRKAQAASPFQMYKPVLKINNVEPVGNYALRLLWSDGHSAGIYSYDHLRESCPCPECAGQR